MTNWEARAEVLKKFLANGERFAKLKGEIAKCSLVSCTECDFYDDIQSCPETHLKWLNAEAAPTLTADERKLCELLKTGYIAQDNDGDIYHYTAKPVKGDKGNWGDGGEYVRLNGICGVCGATFEGISDRKTKAWTVEELLALEVRD